LTPRLRTQRAMSLYRNVTPLTIQDSTDRDAMLDAALAALVENGYASAGDQVVLTVGEPMGQAGGTNALKIVKVGER